MKQFNDFAACSIGTATSVVGTSLQTDLFLQRLSIIITIVGGIITIIVGAIALIKSLRAWWIKAKEDGKITEDEVKEGMEILTTGVKEIQDNLNDKKKGDKNGL